MIQFMFTQFTQPKLSDFFEAIAKVFVVIILLFEDIKTLLIAVFVLITIDQITGVWKALYIKEFSWKKFNQVYSKVILYLMVIMATFIYGHFIVELEAPYFTKGIATVIGFQELSSSYLNISSITGKKYIELYLKKIKSKL